MGGLPTIFKDEVAEIVEGLIQTTKDAGGSEEYRCGYWAAMKGLLMALGYELLPDGTARKKQ